jgi:hypothetical protein
MATETLRLDITADSAQAKAELQKLNNQLAIFERALKKATDPAQIQYLNRNIEFLRGNIQTATTANQRFAQGSNQAANALTNLGRVAQDAPFGFIGIQNNLNPLLESFQRLKAETGSTGGALKSLAGSLIGPAGLGLALSVGSGLLLAFGDRLFKTKETISEAAKAYEEYNKVQRDANKDAAKDIVNAKILYEATQNVALSMKDRLKAATELKDLYPQLLGKYSAEKIVLGEVKNLYNDLTSEIIKNARAKAYAAKISELEAKKLDAEVQMQKIINAGNKERARTQNDAFNPQGIAAIDKGSTAAEKNAEITARGTRAIKEQADIIKNASDQQKFYENAIGKTNLQQQTLNDITDKAAKKVTSLKDEVANYIKELLYLRTIQQQGMRDVSTRAVRSAEIQAPEAVGNDAMVKRTQAVIAASQAQLSYANALRLTTMNEEQAAQITNVAMSAFTSLGNAMLQGQDIGEALSNTFKRLIVDLTAMIARALIFKAIMAAITGGGSAIASSAGATVGKGIMAMLGGIRGFADGGIATGPKSGYPAILHGTEAILNPRQFKNLTSNMMNFGAMRGMGQSQPVNGQVVLRGQDLVLALDRAGVNLNLRRG